MNRPLLEKALEAQQDMLSGWKYIRETHGDLYGVGWDRAQQKAEESIAALRAALEQEPVDGYAIKGPDGQINCVALTEWDAWEILDRHYYPDFNRHEYGRKGYTCVTVTISERRGG